MILHLTGAVVATAQHNGIRVGAWDAEGICPDLIDVAVTDERGQFEMRVERAYMREVLPQRRPELAFRIFHGEKLVAQAKRVTWALTASSTRLQIPLGRDGVDGEATRGPAPMPAQLVVRGTVSMADGGPAAGVTVRALDRSLSKSGFAEVELGSARTGNDGRYEIRYSMPAGGKVKPDLIVRAEAAGTSGTGTTAIGAGVVWYATREPSTFSASSVTSPRASETKNSRRRAG